MAGWGRGCPTHPDLTDTHRAAGTWRRYPGYPPCQKPSPGGSNPRLPLGALPPIPPSSAPPSLPSLVPKQSHGEGGGHGGAVETRHGAGGTHRFAGDPEFPGCHLLGEPSPGGGEQQWQRSGAAADPTPGLWSRPPPTPRASLGRPPPPSHPSAPPLPPPPPLARAWCAKKCRRAIPCPNKARTTINTDPSHRRPRSRPHGARGPPRPPRRPAHPPESEGGRKPSWRGGGKETAKLPDPRCQPDRRLATKSQREEDRGGVPLLHGDPTRGRAVRPHPKGSLPGRDPCGDGAGEATQGSQPAQPVTFRDAGHRSCSCPGDGQENSGICSATGALATRTWARHPQYV